MEYTIHVAGLTRNLPLCQVNQELYIAAFVIFGDVELTIACARDLLKIVVALCQYDGSPLRLTPELIDEACSSYFVT